MTMKPTWTAEQQRRAVKYLNHGMNETAIGRAMGLSARTVGRMLDSPAQKERTDG